MKIAVIGTFVLDQIYTYRGTKVESLGGISYTTSVLANLLTEEDEIYPVANIGADSYNKIINFLTQYNNVRLTGINKENRDNSRVTLKYHNKESRDEFLQKILSPIPVKQLSRIGKVDVILINFITGFELSLVTCNRICSQHNALIYMDFHSLTLGIDDQGRRFQRKPKNWEKWLIGVDILQMNEYEALVLSNHNGLSALGHKIIDHGIKIVNITLGSKGSLLFAKQDNNTVISKKFSAFTVPKVIDVTGCGDAFAGGFIVDYVKNNNDVLNAARNANRVAGFNCTLLGIEQINKLAKVRS